MVRLFRLLNKVDQEEMEKINDNWTAIEGKFGATDSNYTLMVGLVKNIENRSISALDKANEAKNKANGVDAKASTALTNSQKAVNDSASAKQTAETVRNQFNQIVAQTGSNNPEVVAARTNTITGASFATVGQRLDSENEIIMKQLNDVNMTNSKIKNGINVVRNAVPSPINLNIKGRTLHNMLGTGGNIESTVGFGIGGNPNAKFELTKEIVKYGNNSLKCINDSTATGTTQSIRIPYVPKGIKQNSKYIVLMDILKNTHSRLRVVAYTSEGTVSTSTTNDNTGVAYTVLTGSQLLTTTHIAPFWSTIGQPSECIVDGFRIYEIQNDLQDPTITTLTSSEIDAMYPYVEDYKHLFNPYVETDSGNLLPPFSVWEHNYTPKIISDYELEMTTTGISRSMILIEVAPNTDYFINMDTDIYYAVANSTVTANIIGYGRGPRVFYSGVHSYVTIVVSNYSSSSTPVGTFYCKNPMLSVGNTPKLFTPRRTNNLRLNTVLASIGNTTDVLYKDEGEYKVFRSIVRNVEIDGSFPWVSYSSGSSVGYRGVMGVGVIGPSVSPGNSMLWDFKNNLLISAITGNPINGEYRLGASPANNYLYISLSNVETGWTDAEELDAKKISAYFNGWKKVANGWVSIVDGSSPSQNNLDWVAINRAPGLKPYILNYITPNPLEEIVEHVGDITMGYDTLVKSLSGVVEESIEPITHSSSGYYHINNNTIGTIPANHLSNRARDIVKVYKDGMEDPGWIKTYDSAFGNVRVLKDKKIYDPNGKYTVVYETMDKVISQEVNISYSSNIRTSLENVVSKQSDIANDVSTNARSIIDLYIRLKALEGN